ncbi:MAG TPA: PilZ domain-containing protein [Bacillota bacterium]|jgi:c-di-GMP-binding flagellar brake protein YcgR|nr:PilZ domain-containing protein [Bacillota bacterium]HOL10932.1 PilZ domain-containing protein [Bacillota bacterium]HPO98649.1 PilZ domain-containing protein [Bacillota bacterium]
MSSDSFNNELFKPGNSIQIEFRDQANVRKVYKTFIMEANAASLTIILPEDQEINIQPGTDLVVICKESSENYYFISEIIEIIPGTPPKLILNKPKQIKTYSRRNFFRCDVDLTLIYWDDSKIEKVGKVINLSASGLYAIVPYDRSLKKSALLHCQINLPTLTEPIFFDAKVIRFERTESETNQGVALSFEGINEKIENDIIKYLFQRQRELIQLGHIKVGRWP